mmetsp:Transcript_4978/g.14585  ORF Transcript_4978/g.14585 Transcript_4978/m.14585 type:complete len:81 (-) Transcript_4978:23-265(-)
MNGPFIPGVIRAGTRHATRTVRKREGEKSYVARLNTLTVQDAGSPKHRRRQRKTPSEQRFSSSRRGDEVLRLGPRGHILL